MRLGWESRLAAARARGVRGILVAFGIAVTVGAAGAGCRENGSSSGADQDLAGSVQRFPIDSDNWVLIADSRPDEILVPDALPEPFREVGLRVHFAIERVEPPPNVRMVGIPVRLLRITREGARTRS